MPTATPDSSSTSTKAEAKDTPPAPTWQDLIRDCEKWRGSAAALLRKYEHLAVSPVARGLRNIAAYRCYSNFAASKSLMPLLLGDWVETDETLQVTQDNRLHLAAHLLESEQKHPIRARALLLTLLAGIPPAQLNGRMASFKGLGLVEWMCRYARTTGAWAWTDLVALGLDLQSPIAGRTALQLAIEFGGKDEKIDGLLAPLLEAGADPNGTGACDIPPFQQAFLRVMAGELPESWLNKLVEYGADPNRQCGPQRTNTALEACCLYTSGSDQLMADLRLMRAEATWTAASASGKRCAHMAALDKDTLGWWDRLSHLEAGWSDRCAAGMTPFDLLVETCGLAALLKWVDKNRPRVLVAAFPDAFPGSTTRLGVVSPPEGEAAPNTSTTASAKDKHLQTPFALGFKQWLDAQDEKTRRRCENWARNDSDCKGLWERARDYPMVWQSYADYCANQSVPGAPIDITRGATLAEGIAAMWLSSSTLGISPFQPVRSIPSERAAAVSVMLRFFKYTAYSGLLSYEQQNARALSDRVSIVSALRNDWVAFREMVVRESGPTPTSSEAPSFEQSLAYLDAIDTTTPPWLAITAGKAKEPAQVTQTWDLYSADSLTELAEFDETTEVKAFVKKAKAAGNAHRIKRLASMAPLLAAAEELAVDFPHFHDVIEHLVDHCHLQQAGDGSFYLPPLLLTGLPGVGKTFFVERIATCVQTAYQVLQMQSMTANWILTGSSSQWSGSRPGLLFERLTKGDTANPIFLLDELDKCGGDARYSPEQTLLTLLEPENAKRFADENIPLRLDARRVVWMATANQHERISGPLKTRFEVKQVRAPNAGERRALCNGVYKALRAANSWGVKMNAGLPQDTLDLIASDTSPGATRGLRQLLTNASARSLRAGRTEILPDDLRLPQGTLRRAWDAPVAQTDVMTA